MPSYRTSLIDRLWDGKDPFPARHASSSRASLQDWAASHPYLAGSVLELKPTTIIEVGIRKAESIQVFAQALSDGKLDGAVIAVDRSFAVSEHRNESDWSRNSAVAEVSTVLFKASPVHAIQARLTDYIVPVPLTSMAAASLLKSRRITADLIHINGARDYRSVIGDLRVWWPFLRDGGVLIGNDYDPKGGSAPEVAAAFHEFFQTKDIEHSSGRCRVRKPATRVAPPARSVVSKLPARLSNVSIGADEVVLTSFAVDRLLNTTEDEDFSTNEESSILTERNCKNYYMPPIFSSARDKNHFMNDYWRGTLPPIGSYPNESRVLRSNDKFVMGRRELEGMTFDKREIFKNLASLQTLDDTTPFRKKGDGFAIKSSYLDVLPKINGSFIVSFNGVAHNYYHALVEIMVSTFIMRTLLPRAKVLVPNSIRHCTDVNYDELIDVFIGKDHVQRYNDVIRVSNACWIHGDDPLQIPASWYDAFRKFATTRARAADGSGPKKLYVARRGTRAVANAEDVGEVFRKLDFATIYLEDHSITEQIKLFHNAKFVVGPHGAGLSNIIFAQAGTKVLELSSATQFRPFFWILSEKLGLPYSVMSCDTEKADFNGKLTVDVERLSAAIDRLETFSG